MTDIQVENEEDLIREFKQSNVYKEFKNKQLLPKISREREAWQLLEKYRGHYTREALTHIFDTVDFFRNKARWFGSLLATPNMNLIFDTEIGIINQWIEIILFSGQEPDSTLDICLKKNKIKGASKGLATLLLYLSNQEKYNIWVNKTQSGLQVLGRIDEFKGNYWGEYYTRFNKTASEFRITYGLQPQEVDYILTFIASYVESEDNHFLVSEDVLKTEQVALAVDDESDDIDDIVGEPMELGVMRWTPTNEMGVVALFIEFRKDLGFPLIEVIRTRFPDAAVFESSSKGFIRRYIEFEYKSSGYKSHLKTKRKCHYVVCWENDWKDCPIPVLELKSILPPILSKRKK